MTMSGYHLKKIPCEQFTWQSEQDYRTLFENMTQGVLYQDDEGQVLSGNPAAQKILGMSLAQLQSKTSKGHSWRAIHEDGSDFPEDTHPSMLALKTGQEINNVIMGVFNPQEAAYHWINIHAIPQFKPGKEEPLQVLTIFEDITERKNKERTLRESERFIRSTVDALPQHIAILDETGSILAVNKAWRDFALENSTSPEKLCEGANYLEVCKSSSTEKCKEADAFLEAIHAVMKGTLIEFSLEYPCQSPTELEWYMGRITRFDDEGPIRIVVAHENVTELKQAEHAVQRLAYYDPLTGLPNRMLLRDRLNQTLSRAHREGKVGGLIFLDLDRFKIINDTLGHAAGDQLLKAVAKRLEGCVRKSDTVARFGGDEFVIILPSINQAEDATLIAKKIFQALAPPIQVEGEKQHISTSIGIAIYPTDGNDAESLMKSADMAMYQAKQRGRNTYQFFSEEMNRKILEFLNLESHLHQALKKNEFTLHYQPQINLQTGKITGIEALLRWQHPEWGMVYPLEFIPVAEETGQIVPLGEWIINSACAQCKAWQTEGYPKVRITVNLSPRQFYHNNIIENVEKALKTTGLEAQWLELKIAGNSLVENSREIFDALQELKKMGVHLAINNFGISYSTLENLKQFSVDCLKIDQSLIRNLPSDHNNAAIVKAIISMAHKLNLKVIAEGVESEEQLPFLRKHRCDEAQGYLFGCPLPAEKFEHLLQTAQNN